MEDAIAVREIAQEQAEERTIESGIVRSMRGQSADIQLDGSKKQIRDVLIPPHVVNIDVGWWVMIARVPRATRWIAVAAFEFALGSTQPVSADLFQPSGATATAKPYFIELSWDGSFQDVATYEVQHNSAASETGATTIKVEGSNFFYWCAPGVQRYFRVRGVSSAFERSSWSDWVNATATAGEAYMHLGINAGATAPEWQPFDWDLVNTTTGADMVHDHSSNAEGGELPLASLGSYAQGSIIRGGAADWEAHAAETVHFILVGDGTDIVSKAFDWDDLTAGAGADMVHDHSAAGEGGEIPVASLGSYVRGRIIRGGAADWEGYAAQTDGAILVGDGTDIVSDTTPTLKDTLSIDQQADRRALNINSEATTEEAMTIYGYKGLLITQDITNGYGLYAIRDIAEAGANPLVTFINDNAANAQATLRLRQDGTGPALEFTGGTGTNVVTVPNALAIGMTLVDSGAVEYLRLKTAAQLETHFNVGLADIDFIVDTTLANSLVARGSDGAVYADFGIGVGTYPTADYSVNIDKTFTAVAGDTRACSFVGRLNPAGASAAAHFGCYGTVRTLDGNAQNFTNYLAGFRGGIFHEGDGTIDDASGARFLVAIHPNSTGGVITEGQGLLIQAALNLGGGGSAITTNYGIKVENQTAGGTNHGIYVAGASTYALWLDSGVFRWDDNIAAPGTVGAGAVTNRYGGATNFLADPDNWLRVNIGGAVHKVPCYL